MTLEPYTKEGAPCALCHLCSLRSEPLVPTYVPAEGDGVMLVGEAPGAAEVAKGQGFVGPSGRLLRAVYTSVGGDFDRAIRTNVVLCRPPENRDPEPGEIAACAPRLQHEIDTLQPAKLVALGRFAERVLTESQGAERVIAAVHPAFVLRQGSALPKLQHALERVVRPRRAGVNEALQSPPDVTVIRTKTELQAVLAGIADQSWVSFDIETNQVQWVDRMFGSGEQYGPDSVLCLAFTTGVGYGWIVPDYLLYDCPGVPELLSQFFARVRTIAHNSKFDIIFLRSIGIDAHCDVDTLLLHYTLDETKGTHGLKDLSSEELSVPDYETELVARYLSKASDFYSKIPEDKLYLYAVWDVCSTLALATVLKARALREKTSAGLSLWETPFLNFRMPVNKMLIEAEWDGVKVDIPYLLLWKDRLADRAEHIRKRLAAFAGDSDFNPNSPPQVKRLMFQRLGLPMTEGLRTRESGNDGRVASKLGSTSVGALAPLRGLHPAVDLLREYRTCIKMRSSYIMNLLNSADRRGRVHTSYLQYGTVTGRLSSRNPGLQQIPRGGSFYGQIIKAAFIADDGCVFIDGDYAQAQLRIFAALTGDPFMLNVYQNDLDMHNEVMIAQYGPADTLTERERKQYRYYCKVFNFGWAFGGGAEMLAELMPSRQIALEFVARYEQTMAVAAQWRRDQVKRAAKYGYVESRLGTRRRGYFGSLEGPEAINAPVQCGEAEVLCRAAVRLRDEGYRVLLLVHDSLNEEVAEEDGETARVRMTQVMLEEGERLFPEVKWDVDVDPPKKRWLKQPSDEEVNAWLHSTDPENEEGVFGDVAAKFNPLSGLMKGTAK